MGGNMRIIAGQFRGRRLASAKSRGTRPSTERLREALFNILGDWIENKRVLDLFAGTGAIGLEALSRKAIHATFVERNRLSLGYLRRNIESLGIEQDTEVLATEVTHVFYILRDAEPFDLIYIDPPYGQPAEGIYHLLTKIQESRILAPGGKLFLEESSALGELPALTSLELKEVRRYGRTHLWEFSCQMD